MTKKQQMIKNILLAIVTLAMLASGGAKIAGLPFEVDAFARWGYPLWFMYLIGACEVLGVIGLHIQKLSRCAGAGLIVLLIGAISTHSINHESLLAPIPATLLLLMVLGIIYLSHLKIKTTA